MWSVTRIDEADYGCEERMPGEPLLVLVTIESDDGRMCRFECAENWLLQQGIDEGDEWPEDIDVRRAEEAKHRAEERIRQRQSILESQTSKIALARAMVRLRATHRYR